MCTIHLIHISLRMCNRLTRSIFTFDMLHKHQGSRAGNYHSDVMVSRRRELQDEVIWHFRSHLLPAAYETRWSERNRTVICVLMHGENFHSVYNFAAGHWHKAICKIYFIYTVKPRFTNASDHEQFGLRTNFPNTKRLRWRTVSSYEHASRQHRGAISWEYQRRQYS